MSSDRKELIEAANEMGLEFHSNIPTEKLRAMIQGEASAGVEEEEEVVPEEKAEVTEDTTFESAPLDMRAFVKKAKADAIKTKIVTITNLDNRENDFMTTVPLGFENAYFGLSRTVPLDIPVELEVSLIAIAESTSMTMHKDEIVDGKRTGNKVPTRVKKFAVNYGTK